MISMNRQNVNVIYKQDQTEITKCLDFKLPCFSRVIYVDENLRYARPISFVSMLANVSDDELTDEIIVEVMQKDSDRIRSMYFEGLKKKDINYALTYHASEDKLDQILKIVENDHFSNEDLEKYIENNLTASRVRLLYEKLVYLYYEHLNPNYNGICIDEISVDENYIASGSSRSVYKFENGLVLKVHDNDCGKDQSINEYRVMNKLEGDIEYLSTPIYICRDYSIYRYYTPLNRDSDNIQDINDFEVISSYNINYECLESVTRLANKLQDYSMGLDVLGVRNIGMRNDGKLIILDYGASINIIEYGYEDAEINIDEIIEICTKIKDLIYIKSI